MGSLGVGLGDGSGMLTLPHFPDRAAAIHFSSSFRLKATHYAA
jgi:hypothetical protein